MLLKIAQTSTRRQRKPLLHVTNRAPTVASIEEEEALKTEQTTPPLSEWVNDEGSKEKAHGDADCNLNDRESDIERNRVDAYTSTHVRCTDRGSVSGGIANNLIG